MSEPLQLHGSLLAYQGIGCLLLGPSGAGKSKLLLESQVLGGKIVADDQVRLALNTGMLMGSPRQDMQGVQEIRGVGLARWPDSATQQVVHVVVELVPLEQVERFPARETRDFHGVMVPILRLPVVPYTNGMSLLATIKAVHEQRILPADWHPRA